MPEEMLAALKEKELVIVPELNYLGQFGSVLRGEGINAVSLTQYTGLPFKVRELVSRINELIKDGVAV